MAGTSRPGKTILNEGSVSYIILCYARMRRGWFTSMDYAGFQLNRREKYKNFSHAVARLVSNRYLITDTGTDGASQPMESRSWLTSARKEETFRNTQPQETAKFQEPKPSLI